VGCRGQEKAGTRELTLRQGGAGWVFGIADLRALRARSLPRRCARRPEPETSGDACGRPARPSPSPGPDIPRGLVSAGGWSSRRAGDGCVVGRSRLAISSRESSWCRGPCRCPKSALRSRLAASRAGAGLRGAARCRHRRLRRGRLPSRLTVRARRRGDRFMPWGGAQERRLKSLLIDAGRAALGACPRGPSSRQTAISSGWPDSVGPGGARRARTTRILEVTLSVPLVVASPGR